MYILYKIQNNINKKNYIGYTSTSLHNRWRSHVNSAISANSPYPFHKAIRKYGFQNFSLEIIEVVETKAQAMEQEKYWIDKYNSYVAFNKGYNATFGGDDNLQLKGDLSPSAKLNQTTVDLIIQDLITTDLTYEQIILKYNISVSDREISSINNGEAWHNDQYTYPLRPNCKSLSKQGEKNPASKLTENDVRLIIDMLLHSKITQTDIARLFNVSYNTINCINRCKTWSHIHNYNHNIRKGE